MLNEVVRFNMKHNKQGSSMEFCIFLVFYGLSFIGLSKERPILGDHPKAHIHEIRRISCENMT